MKILEIEIIKINLAFTKNILESIQVLQYLQRFSRA